MAQDEKITNGFTTLHGKGKLYLDARMGRKMNAGQTNHCFLTIGNMLKTIEGSASSMRLNMLFFITPNTK